MARLKLNSDIKPVEYEKLLEEIEYLRDVRLSEAQFKAGNGVSHSDAKAVIRSRIKR